MHVQAKRTMPEIVASGLRLRPWRTHDAVALVDAVQSSIQSLGRWLPWPRADYGLAEAAAWIEQCQDGWQQGGHFAFAAFDQGTGALLGAAGLNQLNPKHRSGNLGYWVRQSRQGQGIASRTALEVARFGFSTLALVRIEIVTPPHHHASRRTAEKIGARFEAVARQRLWIDGQAEDAAVYGLIPADLSG